MNELPNLFYDTLYSANELYENKPYRNIGDLLVKRCPSVINILKLCGADERIISGDCSDYESFYCLCSVMENMPFHPVYTGIRYILSNIFKTDEVPSTYNCDQLWFSLNSQIEASELTPISALKMLNTESVCIRRSLDITFPDFDGCEIDIYPITDLCDIVSTVSGSDYRDINAFINSVSNSDTVRLVLKKSYKYVRNSKKTELESLFDSIKHGKDISTDGENALISYIAYNIAKICSCNNLNLIIECKCVPDELDALFSYFSLNKCLPESSVIVCDNPSEFEAFLIKHTFRNTYGLPSVIPVCKSYEKLKMIFPIGLCLEYQGSSHDLVTLSSVLSERGSLSQFFGEEIAENMCYTNIKNRMRI